MKGKPTLQELSAILRDKSRWPKGFEWDYSDCATCAMGMAKILWKIKSRSSIVFSHDMAEVFGMPYDAASRIFAGLADYSRAEFFGAIEAERAITPEHVADAIDAYLASNRP